MGSSAAVFAAAEMLPASTFSLALDSAPGQSGISWALSALGLSYSEETTVLHTAVVHLCDENGVLLL